MSTHTPTAPAAARAVFALLRRLQVGTLDVRIGEAFAEAAMQLLAEAGIAPDAIIAGFGNTLLMTVLAMGLGILLGLVAALAGWFIWAFLTYLIGTKLLRLVAG